ncbi:MAG: hypothetical protein L0170_12640 [Acidobacteria bacterium]|nr:hypothetical protein [Acidobacteriota bacterium]
MGELDPEAVESPAAVPADDSFLDEVFDRALEMLEEGLEPDVQAWLKGREALGERIAEAVQLARDVAVHRPPPPASMPKVAGYQIERELGSGSMGTVYLARQNSLGGRRVALKVLPPSFRGS